MADNIHLGVLTGISYVTGLDYYKRINEYFMRIRNPIYSLSPNPNLVFASVDCDKYVHLLEKRQFDKVSNHLMEGVKKLVDSGCNYLAIASNTGHICYEDVKQKYPTLNIIHIADCIAREFKKKSYGNVGLVGTKPTMEENHPDYPLWYSSFGFYAVLRCGGGLPAKPHSEWAACCYEPRVDVYIYRNDQYGYWNPVSHVAGRADNRTWNWQWNLPDYHGWYYFSISQRDPK